MVGYLLRLDKFVGEEGRTESQEEGDAIADLGPALSRHIWRLYWEGWGLVGSFEERLRMQGLRLKQIEHW